MSVNPTNLVVSLPHSEGLLVLVDHQHVDWSHRVGCIKRVWIRFPYISNNFTSAATHVPSVLVSTSHSRTQNHQIGWLNSNKIPFLLVVDQADSSFQKKLSLRENGFGAVSWSVDASLIEGKDVVWSWPRRSDHVIFLSEILVLIVGALICGYSKITVDVPIFQVIVNGVWVYRYDVELIIGSNQLIQ